MARQASATAPDEMLFPSNYSAADIEMVRWIIQRAERSTRPFAGDLAAPWLLVPFESPRWRTTNGRKHEKIGDKWVRTTDIEWAVRLPDGRLLTDPVHEKLLRSVRMASWLIRSGLDGLSLLSPIIWERVTEWMLRVAMWTVLNSERYQPDVFGLSAIDQRGMNDLIRTVALGGWLEALQIPQRLLAIWFEEGLGEECPPEAIENPLSLESRFVKRLILWFRAQGWYTRREGGEHIGVEYISRARAAQAVHCDKALVLGLRGSVFFRQFEPQLAHRTLHLTASQNTEYPSHRTLTKQEAERGETFSSGDFVNSTMSLRRLLAVHRHIPDLVPSPSSISVREISAGASRLMAAERGHTPFIPVQNAVTLLRESIRWVHVYGEALVSGAIALSAAAQTARNSKATAAEFNRALRACFTSIGPSLVIWKDGREVPLVEALNIIGPTRRNADAPTMRVTPAFAEAVAILVGACTICIAMLKPSREDELCHLQRDCLVKGDDGYYLRFHLGKSNAGEAVQLRDRPIPYITAKAIELLQRLGAALGPIFNEEGSARTKLFYVPSALKFGRPSVAPRTLSGSLDLFCDYLATPLDGLGRRWYVRVHEMRKWFLLVFFWAGRMDVLDSARWIAGHTDAAHTWEYLELHFPGDELPEMESEYSVDRLRRLDSGESIESESAGLEGLYRLVCKRFGVRSLSFVPEGEWAAYVKELRRAGGFRIEPHSLFAANGTDVVGLTISFKLSETES